MKIKSNHIYVCFLLKNHMMMACENLAFVLLDIF